MERYREKESFFLTGHTNVNNIVTKKLGIEGEFSNAQMIIYLREETLENKLSPIPQAYTLK